MSSLFKKAGLDGNTEIGLLRKAVLENPKLSHFVLHRSLLDYNSLRVSVLAFDWAKNVFSARSSSSSFTPKKIIQRRDVGERETEVRDDGLASQLSELSSFVENSRTTVNSQDSDTSEKVYSSCREPRHSSTTCPRDEHRNRRFASCKKSGHCESRWLKKLKKNAPSANFVIRTDKKSHSDTSSIASVALLADD